MDRSTTNESAMVSPGTALRPEGAYPSGPNRRTFCTSLPTLAIAIVLLLSLTQTASARINLGGITGNPGSDLTFRPTGPGGAPPETVPFAPILTPRWKTQSVVMLDYLDVSLVETGFDLESRRAGGQWRVIASFAPLSGRWVGGNHRVTGLEPLTDYCFRMTARNAAGVSPANEVCVRTTHRGACGEAKLEEVLAQATDEASEVWIDCHLYLEPKNFVFKRLVFVGSSASRLTVDLNGATISGGVGTFHDGRHDMIEVRSDEIKKRDVENAISSYDRPSDITIRNGTVIGSIRIWGMATNGEGDGVKKIQCSGNTCYEVDVLATNQLKKSSRLPGHTERVQGNAPTNIVLERLTIWGQGRNPVYFAPGVTNSKLIDSHVLGWSNAVGVYLDAESAGNTLKGNVIDVATKDYPFEQWDRPLVAIDGSANNRFINNYFGSLSHGGIYLYRNCGENGVIRHQTPSQNVFLNNIFPYNTYDGDNPAIFIGSRNRGGVFHDTVGFCEHDAGFPYGSSANDEDFSRYNAIMQNQIVKRSISDMIKTNNPSINAPNYIVGNTTVTDATLDLTRLAGCYNGDGTSGFVSHGGKFTRTVGSTGCSGTEYTCDNGELIGQPFDRCVTVTGGKVKPVKASRK